jgi:hypothetical protein
LGESQAEQQKPSLEGRFANHFAVAFTEHEFLLDFGQAYNTAESVLVHTRIIMAPTSAKTLVRMLQQLVQQYESEVGAIAAGSV